MLGNTKAIGPLKQILTERAGRGYTTGFLALFSAYFVMLVVTPPEGDGLRIAASLALVGGLIAVVVAAFCFDRDLLTWSAKATLFATAALFAVLIGWTVGTGQTTDEIMATLLGGFLASVAGALLVTGAMTLIAFVFFYLYVGPGGRGGSPEEQILDKDDS